MESGRSRRVSVGIMQSTVGQNNQEYRLKYWAIRSSVRSFARTAHSFSILAHSVMEPE